MTTLPLYEHIKTIFKETDFTSSEGEFLTGKIFEAIERVDRAFMAILLKDTTAKSHFFDAIEEAYVLNQTKLYEFFNAKEYFDNSYTSYTNKIGLIKKESFIKKFDDVVLAFPYKDCVLEGGMNNEEASKKEVFYNAIISKDEIDRLFEPKVLTNIQKFDTNGQHVPEQISMDDNLIIKGNNLLALHSLKQRYAGKIKLIYIDPPYNTGNDGFKYNDRFNHSTWLTFMKNRLEVARELLRDDGVIFVQCDDNEQAYLKVLMDEIYINGFVQVVCIKKATSAGFKAINECPITTKEFILIYKKNINTTISLNQIFVEAGYVSDYDTYIPNINDNPQNWEFIHVNDLYYSSIGVTDWKEAKNIIGTNWKYQRSEFIKNFIENNYTQIVSFKDLHKPSEKIKSLMNQSLIDRDNVYILERENQENLYFKKGRSITFYKNKFKNVDGNFVPAEILSDIWTDIKWDGIASEGGVQMKNGKKPEKLIQRIIELSTQENDIVLDYHLGSSTTCAVAHKMNRRYIGIEQMDYIQTIAVERMKKVIEAEQGGISKAVEWKGGGSFIYAELKTIDTFNEADTIGRLNDNMRYLPLGEIDDESYGISESEKTLNKQFYGVE